MLSKVKYVLDHYETILIIESLKREKRMIENRPHIKIDELIEKFEKGKEKHKHQKDFNISPRIKKAREEYEKIFFERYGVKK
tara:strand:+ start:426 stop:671 length:246 start_codon:yes stop_codon:yes gene_type:complete